MADINLDGYPDIYIGNDFQENDYLYLNQHNGTFNDVSRAEMKHTSQYTMGVDNDLTNDGLPEIMTLDMLPHDPIFLKGRVGQINTIFRVYKAGVWIFPGNKKQSSIQQGQRKLW